MSSFKYKLVLSSRFKKSLKRLASSRDFDKENYDFVLSKLLNKEKLDSKYRNHKLSGEYEGCMECHLQNDMLLIYQYHENLLILYGVNIGTHSEMF